MMKEKIDVLDWEDMFEEEMDSSPVQCDVIWDQELQPADMSEPTHCAVRNGVPVEYDIPAMPWEELMSVRLDQTIDALKVLHDLVKDNRYATESECETLARYTGTYLVDMMYRPQDQIVNAFPEDGLSISNSMLPYPYIQDPVIVETIFRILGRIGFEKGNILLREAGVGAVLRAMDKTMRESSRIDLSTDDPILKDIESFLYPTVPVLSESDPLQSSYYDAIIAEIPCRTSFAELEIGQNAVPVPGTTALVLKMDRALRPGGVLLMTMDENAARSAFFDRGANMVALSNMAHLDFLGGLKFRIRSASRFLFLFQKRSDSRKSSWPTYSWKSNTEKIDPSLPEMEVQENIETQILGWGIEGIYHEVESDAETEDAEYIPANPNVRNFEFVLVNGEVYQRVDSRMIRQKLTGRALERVKGMIAIRQQTERLLKAEMSDLDDDYIEVAQEKLNRLYDSFVKVYGPVTSRANFRLFREDIGASVLAALERQDEDGKIEKTEIFTQRTLCIHKLVSTCDTLQEGCAVCIDRLGKIDLAFIAQLCQKTVEEVQGELEGSMIFRNPHPEGADDEWILRTAYLSGPVLKKYREAQEAAENSAEFEINVEALKQVLPDPIPSKDIYVTLASSFVDDKFIVDFADYLLGSQISHPYTDELFSIEYQNDGKRHLACNHYISPANVVIYSTYGIPEMGALALFDRLLNQRSITVYDKVNTGGDKTRFVTNTEKTIAAQEKANLIAEKFTEWIFSDPDREREIVESYNSSFNDYVIPTYDGSHLTFPGMSMNIELRPHQKNAVFRIIQENGAFLNHAVGSGKTFTMIAAGMELERLGRIRKPLYLVPNNLLTQWGGEMMRLYPTKKVLIADPSDMRKERRKRFLTRVAIGDYDAIIMGSSSFDTIPAPIHTVRETIEHNFQAKNHCQETPVTKLEKSLQDDLYRSYEANESADFNFEDLGVDYLFVDESHGFKNLRAPSGSSVQGISSSSSHKATDLYYKTKYLSSLHGGKGGYVFATGTAIVNSIVELFSAQRFFQEDLLFSKGIYNLRDWVKNFAVVTAEWELPPEGLDKNGKGFRQVMRVSSFQNVPELMHMVLQFMDTVTSSAVDMETPNIVEETVSCPMSEDQRNYMDLLVTRAREIRTKGTIQANDNMLSVTNDGRKAALDMRIIDPLSQNFPHSKVSECARKVAELYFKYNDVRSTQIIFSDISVPNQNKEFSVYTELKKLLIYMGIPENEIAIAHDYKTATQFKTMQSKMQAGQIRVLIGSTGTVGQGLDVQRHLIALHELDTPWTPKDVEQRLGRIKRPGNLNKTAFIFTYVTEGSFDAYMWQCVERKAKMIAQILRGDLDRRTVEDVDAKALSYSEIKAISSGDPRFLQRAKLEAEIARLQALKHRYDDKIRKVTANAFRTIPDRIKQYEERIPSIEQDIADTWAYRGSYLYELAGQKYDLLDLVQKEKAAKALQEIIAKRVKYGDSLGKLNGLEIIATPSQSADSFFSRASFSVALNGHTSHALSRNAQILNAKGALNFAANTFDQMDYELQEYKEKLRADQLALNASQDLISNSKFEKQEELDRLIAEYEELNATLTA